MAKYKGYNVRLILCLALYQYDIMNVISFWRNPVVDLQYVACEGKKEN